MKNQKKSEYFLTTSSSISLDLIRVIAAQAVLIGHSLNYFDLFPFIRPPYFEFMQNIAVVVFFILSGFLITYSIYNKINNADYTFAHFFIDRFSRIYTGFVPAIFFVFFIDILNKSLTSGYIFNVDFNLKTFLGNLFMLQDFPYLSFVSTFGSAKTFWTISIEWWIYLSVGWLIFKIYKRRLSIKNFLIFVLLSVVPYYNLLLKSRGHCLTVIWIMGAVILLVSIKFHNKTTNYTSIIINSMLSFLFLYLAYQRVTETKSAYEIFFSVLLSLFLYFLLSTLQQINFKHEFAYKYIIRFLANYSLTLYLIHYSIVDLIHNLWYGHYTSIYLLAFSFIVSNTIAAIIAFFTEMKYKKIASWLKNYFLTKNHIVSIQ